RSALATRRPLHRHMAAELLDLLRQARRRILTKPAGWRWRPGSRSPRRETEAPGRRTAAARCSGRRRRAPAVAQAAAQLAAQPSPVPAPVPAGFEPAPAAAVGVVVARRPAAAAASASRAEPRPAARKQSPDCGLAPGR